MRECAPTVHPETLSRIIRTESGGQAFALADAGPAGLPWSVRKGMVRSYFPSTKGEAAAIVKSLLDAGHLVSIGLTQVNNRQLPRLNLSVEDVLDPCTNLKTGAQILVDFYVVALKKYGGDEQRALVAAVSAYETGDFAAGVADGYVKQVLAGDGGQVPALKKGRTGEPRPVGKRTASAAPSALEAAKAADMEVGSF
jgi:type IV secretion system protein VirB1